MGGLQPDGEAAGRWAPPRRLNGDGIPDVLITSTSYGSLYLAAREGVRRPIMESGIGS